MSQVCTGVDGRCQTKTKPRKKRIYHYRPKSHQRVACTKFPCSTPPKQYLSISYYHLRDLRRIRKFLGVETAILLANAMVSSRLDYCNSLLYGVSKSNIAKLQRVQNALCRIIFRLDKMSHVTPFLKKLHWLPIQHRILFKYNLLVFKAINLSQPLYLSALIRSSSLTRGNRLSVSSTRPKKHIGRRGFAVAVPAEWNKLPQTVRSQQTTDGFRSQLKTYLFRLAGAF